MSQLIPHVRGGLEIVSALRQATGRRIVGAGHVGLRPEERAVALIPHSAEAHLLIGRVFAVRGQFENAAHAFARVIEIDPEQADAREYLQRIATMRASQVRAQKDPTATR